MIDADTVLPPPHIGPTGTFRPGRATEAVFFFGAIDVAPFNRVTLTKSTVNDGIDGILFDDVTIGFSSVPEPASLALGGAAAAGVWFGVRQRRRAKGKPSWSR